MSNMNYCRFKNTRSDVTDCLEAIRRDEGLSDTEAEAGLKMFQEFLAFCRDYDIIEGYDAEALKGLFAGQRSGGAV